MIRIKEFLGFEKRHNALFIKSLGQILLQTRLNGGLIFSSAPLTYPSHRTAQTASQAGTLGSVLFSARGAGFPQERGGRRSPALPVNSQTRCLLSPKREIFSLCVSLVRSWFMSSYRGDFWCRCKASGNA